MASARSRLTTAYAVALIGTMILFAGALYIARRTSSPRALDRPGEVAEQALAILRDAAARDSLFAPRSTPTVDTLGPLIADTALVLSDVVQQRLELLPADYVFVTTRDAGRPLFVSRADLRDDQAALDEFLRGIPRVP